MKKLNLKGVLTIGTAAVLIALALLGGNWGLGKADSTATLPTIPGVVSFSPHMVKTGSAFTLTIHGSNINPLPYVAVRWYRSGIGATMLTPTAVTGCVANVCNSLTVNITADLVDQADKATVYVVNNPASGDLQEIKGPLSIQIVDNISTMFLPLVNR